MSPRYKCKDCGFRWDDVEVKKGESNYFLRCLRCESRNIISSSKITSSKIIILLIVSLITGSIGAGIGIWIRLEFLVNWGDPWMFGLIGFLVGFLGAIIFYFFEINDYLWKYLP